MKDIYQLIEEYEKKYNLENFIFETAAKYNCDQAQTLIREKIIEIMFEENKVLKKAFRNLIEEYLSVMNYINGDSLKVTKKEIDEDFDDRIQQAKESERDE